MGKVKEAYSNAFKYSYDGVLNHDGSILVAKTPIRQKILNVSDKNVLVQSSRTGKSYVCEIHKHLIPLMEYVENGDIAFIKWKNGNAWIVGFQKKKSAEQENGISIESTEDLNKFMREVDVE